MSPSGSTSLTMPTCSLPNTIRSPGWGTTPGAFAIARPALCAQDQISLTAPSPSPWGPSGVPAWRVAHDAKYAHQGAPGMAPAVALRYSAIAGDSFDPGGCSVWPIWLSAIATIRAPEPPVACGPDGSPTCCRPGTPAAPEA